MQPEAFPKNAAHSPVSGCCSTSIVDFSELVRLQWRDVFRICLRITRDHHDAEDAAQECFLLAFSRLHQFRGKAQISAWLHSIARNCSLMLLRKRRIRQEVQFDNPGEGNSNPWLLEISDSRADQLSRVIYAENVELLATSIAALPDALRTPTTLSVLKAQSLREIGQILDISNASVKSRLFRARRRLSRFVKRRYQMTRPTNNVQVLSE